VDIDPHLISDLEQFQEGFRILERGLLVLEIDAIAGQFEVRIVELL